MPDLARDRIEGVVNVVRRALVAHPHLRFTRDALAERREHARLADARFAGDERDLAFALARLAPSVEEQRKLMLASDKGRHRLRPRRLEAADILCLAQNRPCRNRRVEAFQRLQAKRFHFECAAEQPPCRLRDHDAAEFGEPLQPRRQIRGLAYDRLLLGRALSDDDRPLRQCRSRRQCAHFNETFARVSRLRDNGSDLEAGTDRTLGVFFMRAGKAEIGEHAVAHEFCDETVITRYRSRAGVLIGTDDLAHVLGIEPRRQRGRADQIAEHDGELSPFCRVVDRWVGEGGCEAQALGQRALRRLLSGVCDALKTRRSFRDRHPSGRSEPRRQCHSHEIPLRTARDLGPAAKSRHPLSFPWTAEFDDGLTRVAVSIGLGQAWPRLVRSDPCPALGEWPVFAHSGRPESTGRVSPVQRTARSPRSRASGVTWRP